MAKVRKKKARAIALGVSRIIDTPGIFARFTPINSNIFRGSRNKDKRTEGRIWVPVLISQPAFITDQVHIIAAMINMVLRVHLEGQQKQMMARITSKVNKTEMSASIHSGYSLSRFIRYE